MKLSTEFIEKYKGKQPNWGFNGLGYITYKRTYARPLEDGSTEEWYQTVERCVNWLWETQVKLGIEQPESYYKKLYETVFNLKANFSGRVLWQAGTSTVDKLGGASLYNCYAVVADSKDSFLALFDYLMLGGGVGYNIQQEHVDRLPWIRENVQITHTNSKDADFIVPDSREGWIKLLDHVLTSFFETGESFTFSTVLVRPYGEPIKGFGGTSSGPEPLIKGITKIIDILQTRAGRSLRPIDVLDVMNCIGEIVVAGNVRRSAQIAIGDSSDIEFLKAKDWSSGNIPNHRAMSNNTVVCNDINELPDVFWDGYGGNGEPYGLFNLELARKKGRLIDTHRSDPDAIATNPCAEITLSPTKNTGGAESCNLCEIYLNNIKSEEEFKKVAEIMYPVVKTIAMMPHHRPESEKIIKNNLRLGIGITGIVQAPELVKPEILTNVYQHLEDIDRNYSQKWAVPESIKLTTVKPSGTLSLLAGATPGIHPAYSHHYIRRVRMSSGDSLVQLCKEAGYHVEFVKNFDETEDKKTVVVEFPIKLDKETIVASEMTAIKQLDLHKHIQTYWADNQVSVTVYYKKEELSAIKKWLRDNYNLGVKTVSFLLHNEHGFAQAPYEEITPQKYNALIANIKPINFKRKVEELTLIDSQECDTGGCPVR